MTQERIRELMNYSRSYNDWKTKYHELEIRGVRTSSVLTLGPISNRDPVGNDATDMLEICQKIFSVDYCINRIDPDFRSLVRQIVTNNLSIEEVRDICWKAGHEYFIVSHFVCEYLRHLKLYLA